MAEGTTVTFTVKAEAQKPLSYQWQFNGADLPQATGATLTLTTVAKNQAGVYRVVVSTADGTVTSDPANLYVVGPGGEPELSLDMYAGITITGLVGPSYRIEYVEALGDPNNWQPLATIVLPASPFHWFYIQSPHFPKRFYRAVLVP